MDTGGDPGLFGPGSQTWRVHSHPIVWIGGLRALYLQALHPVALRGVFTSSNYRADPWGRLRRTADFVGTTTFGSLPAAEAAGARVRELHHRLGLDDPHLLRWVHCCEVGSFLDVYRRSDAAMDSLAADRYLAEQAAASRLIGLGPAAVPCNTAELEAYFDSMRPELTGDSQARAVARFLLLPPMPTRVRLLTPALPGWAAMSGLAFGALPGWARRMYGVPSLPGTDLRVTWSLRALRLAVNRLPPRLRTGPHLRAAQQRLAAPTPD